jgi:two-component system LytT family response regulator
MMIERSKVATLIVDDEPVARAGMRHMLADVEWIDCVGEAASGPAAVEAIDALRPELVFLDIQMPGISGIEVLRRVTHQPFVVFTTAFAEHAVTAFELGAVDYLLKPFGAERLRASLDRARAALGEPLPATLDRLGELLGQAPRHVSMRSVSRASIAPTSSIWSMSRRSSASPVAASSRVSPTARPCR